MDQLQANKIHVMPVSESDDNNILVINTCRFIDNAKEDSVNSILDYVQKKQEEIIEKVFVTGCLSERYKPDLEKEIPDVDQYFRTTDLPLQHIPDPILKAMKRGTTFAKKWIFK